MYLSSDLHSPAGLIMQVVEGYGCGHSLALLSMEDSLQMHLSSFHRPSLIVRALCEHPAVEDLCK